MIAIKRDNFAYIGIDPGISGGLAVFEGLETKIVSCPSTVKDMADILMPYKGRQDAAIAIESVHSFPGQGVVSTFKFGMNYGQWLGILSMINIPYQLITPHRWQKFYGSMPKEKNLRKTHLKNLAQQRAPLLKVTLKTADAILIANYLRENNS